MHTRPLTVAMILALSIGWSAGAGAQESTFGISQYLLAEARPLAMGGAFTAVAEGPDAVGWNPGALGLPGPMRVGLAYGKLLPEIAPDVHSIGVGASVPLGAVGFGAHLDYVDLGESQVTGTGPTDSILGSFRSYDYTLRLGAGADLARLFLGTGPNFHWGVGASFNLVHSFLVPGWVLEQLGISEGSRADEKASAVDIGLGTLATLRVPLPRGALRDPARADYVESRVGVVLQNALNSTLALPRPTDGVHLGRCLRTGAALEFAAGDLAGHVYSGRALRALVSMELDHYFEQRDVTSMGPVTWPAFHQWRYGAEIALLGVATGRVGHVDNVAAQVKGWTWGLGIGGEIRRGLGVDFDYARLPLADGEHSRRYSLAVRTKL